MSTKREKKLHREILAILMSHDHCRIRLHDHHSIIEGERTGYILSSSYSQFCSSRALNNKKNQTIYKLTENIYDINKSVLLEEICLVVKNLVGVNLKVSQ